MGIGQLVSILQQETDSSEELHIHDKIRINAIKWQGSWWAIGKVHDFEQEDLESWISSGKAMKLKTVHFQTFPSFDMSSGRDKDTLVFDPHHGDTGALRVDWHDREEQVVCTQQTHHQMGNEAMFTCSK